MKLNQLKKAAAKAQQALQLTERQVAELRRQAKAAKAQAEKVRLQQKRLRKAAKEAKKQALEVDERAAEQRRVLEKAQKRLAKALRNPGRRSPRKSGNPPRPAYLRCVLQGLRPRARPVRGPERPSVCLRQA
jgi:hypothetical protein